MPGFELYFWLPSTDIVALLLKLAAPVRTRESSAGCPLLAEGTRMEATTRRSCDCPRLSSEKEADLH